MTKNNLPPATETAKNQNNTNSQWQRSIIAVFFLLLALLCIFCSSRSALYFIERTMMPGGIRARTEADYSPGVLFALAPIDRDRIIAEIGSDELALLSTPTTVEAGAVVVALLPQITPVKILPSSTATPFVSTLLPVFTPSLVPTQAPTDVPSPTVEPASPTSTDQPSVIPIPPTSTPTLPPATPTLIAPSPTAPLPSPTTVPSTATSTPQVTPSTPTPTSTLVPTLPPPNNAPVVNNDILTVAEDSTGAVNVLANDSDPDGTLVFNTLAIVLAPLHGAATVDTVLGKITYTPDLDYFGVDLLDYNICDDDDDCATATVNITVTPEDDPPVAVDDSMSTEEDVVVTLTVLANDSDPDNDILSISGVGTPVNGIVENNSNSLVYTPTLNYNGTDIFTYTLTDGSLGDTATVTVTITPINDAPIALDDSVSSAEDTPESINVLGNDSDVDGDTLTIVSVGMPANGVAITNGSYVLYTPVSNFDGTETFTYTISDTTLTDTATITVSVISINDPPLAVADVYSTSINTPLNISAPGILANDIDPEGHTLNSLLVSGPTTGTLTLELSGAFVYTPNSGFSGLDSFSYIANDGLTDSNTTTVTININ